MEREDSPSAETAEAWLHDAVEAFETGDVERAERLAAELVGRCRSRPEHADVVREAETLLLGVDIELRRDDAALARIEAMRAAAGTDDHVDLLEGRLQMMRWQIDAAASTFDAIDDDSELAADVYYHRAIIAELRGDLTLADRHYERATALDADACPAPVRMPDDEALGMLREIVAAFPPDLAAALDNVSIELAPMPDAAIDGGPDTDPLVLGLYAGAPIGESVDAPLSMPGSVRIFKRNIERVAADREALLEELRITLLHEVGHHLGWDEDDLEARGLA